MRLGLTHKIFGGYLILISLLVAIGGYGGVTLYRLMGEYRQLVTDGIPAQRAMSSLEEVHRLQIGNEKKFDVLGSAAIARLFAAQNTEWERLAGRLASRVHTGPEKALIANLTAGHRSYARRASLNMAHRADPPGENGVLRVTRNTSSLIKLINDGMGQLSRQIRGTQDVMLVRTQKKGDRIAGITLTLGLITVVAGLVAAVGLSVLLTRPVRRLKAATEEVGLGIFDRKVPVASGDEIGDLAAAFNIMARRLESLDEVREEFIAYISHELKTPLTSLKEANSLMIDGVAGRLTVRQKKLLGIVQEDCLKLERLINEMLELSKMEAGMMPFFEEHCTFGTIVQAAMDEMGPVAESRKVRLVTSGDDAIQVTVDPSRIRQVVTNLMSNAIKFSPEGSPVEIGWEASEGLVVCHVADRGPGIPAGARETIFEKFHQLAPSDLSGLRGAGLGLPIARRIINSHGGALWVECPPDGGSSFRFSLPLRAAAELAAGADSTTGKISI